jgi:hypothetical protein
MRRRKQLSFAAKKALLCGLALFALSQLAWDVVLDGWYPGAFDPETSVRLRKLRACTAAAPGRPLLMLVGSSRTVVSFQPERLPPLHTATGALVQPFNWSHFASGPIMNLVQVRRLLRYGIHPDWLVVEVMPAKLNDGNQNIVEDTAEVRDLPVVARYQKPLVSVAWFSRHRLAPCYEQRRFLVHQWLPWWLPPDELPEQDQLVMGPLGGGDGYALSDPSLLRPAVQKNRRDYYAALQDFHVRDLSDRAMHELLELCRRERIQVVLLLTPEGSEFQSWYSPEARRTLEEYCTALSRQYGVPLIDGRNWLTDDNFVDSHHVCVEGAQRFTQRLGSEVLQPLVAGTLRGQR